MAERMPHTISREIGSWNLTFCASRVPSPTKQERECVVPLCLSHTISHEKAERICGMHGSWNLTFSVSCKEMWVLGSLLSNLEIVDMK